MAEQQVDVGVKSNEQVETEPVETQTEIVCKQTMEVATWSSVKDIIKFFTFIAFTLMEGMKNIIYKDSDLYRLLKVMISIQLDEDNRSTTGELEIKFEDDGYSKLFRFTTSPGDPPIVEHTIELTKEEEKNSHIVLSYLCGWKGDNICLVAKSADIRKLSTILARLVEDEVISSKIFCEIGWEMVGSQQHGYKVPTLKAYLEQRD